MTLKIKFLQALHGDSILITNESENLVSRILIDGGPPYAFKSRQPGNPRDGKLKKALDELQGEDQKIDLVILTHVDDDHIGGLLKAFEDSDYLPKITEKVLFNSGQLIFEHFNHPNNVLNEVQGNFDSNPHTSINQGISFEKFISERKLWDRQLMQQSSIFSLSDLKLKFLSPDESTLAKLLNTWATEQESPFTSAANTDYEFSYAELLALDSFKEDQSIPNGSSLSFILEKGDLNLVFLGDAHPSIVIKGLQKLGYTETDPLKAELVKLSHHGSKGNTNIELLKLIKTNKYVVCTDGSKHGLPNKITFARIHSVNPNATILFNYPHLIADIFTVKEREALGERLQVIDGEIAFGYAYTIKCRHAVLLLVMAVVY
jgi:beta-lactamase superfamily II metal-dependent hydrolase